MQQGRETDSAVDGDDPLKQGIEGRQRQVITVEHPPFQPEQRHQAVYLGLVADVTPVHGMMLEQQDILTASMSGKGVHHLGDHLFHSAQVRVLPYLKIFGDLQGHEEDMALVLGQGPEQAAVRPSVPPLDQTACHPAFGLLIEAPGSVIDKMGVAPVKQILADVIAAGIPGAATKGLAHLQWRIIRGGPLHLGQLVTFGIKRAEGIHPPLLQRHVVRAQITLFHGPDGDLLQLADANGLQMVIAAIPIADQAVDTMALDEAAKEGIPGVRLAGETLVVTDARPALIPAIEMDLVNLMARFAQGMAEGLKEGAKRSLQQQNLHVRLIS